MQRLKGLAALLVLIGLLVGIPIGFLAVGANPFSSGVPTLTNIKDALTSPDNGQLFVGALKIAGWLAWASFAFMVLLEIASRLRGVRTPRLPGFGVQQRTAAVLVSAVAVLFTVAGPAMTAAADAPSGPAVTHSQVQSGPQSEIQQAAQAPTGAVAMHDVDGGSGGGTATVEDAPVDTVDYVVQPGDSLYSIAEAHLGDGNRYTEIADLNYQTPQADGGSLTDAHWLNPGWTLQLPAPVDQAPDEVDGPATPEGATGAVALAGVGDGGGDAPPGAASDVDGGTVVVQPGDTLSEIAQDRLGDASAYPEIAAASAETAQPGGERLTDPDLIKPGWKLTLPEESATPGPAADQRPAPAPPTLPGQATTDAPAPDASVSENVKAPATVVDHNGAQHASPSSESSDSPAAADSDKAPLRTIGGASALLAAALLGVVMLRRRQQQRRRTSGGAAIAMPPEQAIDVEAELRAAADFDVMDGLDRALRGVAARCAETQRPLPRLVGARVMAGGPEGAAVQLMLAEPATLPSPWRSRAGSTVWDLPLREDALPTADQVRGVLPPYPLLAPIGNDGDDAHVLFNLDTARVLRVCGNREQNRALLASAMAEIAAEPWCEGATVLLVGSFGAFEQGLLDAFTDRVALCTTTDEALQRLQASAVPSLVVVADHLASSERERLIDGVQRRSQTAVVVAQTNAGGAGWSVQFQPGLAWAQVHPLGIDIVPFGVDDETAAALVEILATAQPAPMGAAVSGDLAAGPVEQAERIRSRRLPRAVPVQPVAPGVLASAAPGTPTAMRAAIADGPTPVAGRPRMCVIGPPTILGATGPVDPAQRVRLTEIAAYLVLHPGATAAQQEEALWPGREPRAGEREQALTALRRWLGRTPDGGDWLDEGLSCDWLEVRRLGGDTGDDHLRATVAQVRGEPFQDVPPRRYVWAELIRQEMTSTLLDAAAALAQRAEAAQNWAEVMAATGAGLLIEPGRQQLWRHRLRAAHRGGSAQVIDGVCAELRAVLSSLDEPLEAETVQVLGEVSQRAPVAAVQFGQAD